MSKAGNALARFLAKTKGADYRSKLLDGMGVGAFAKQIENPRTPHDWVCTDPAVVDAYIADELCGAMFLSLIHISWIYTCDLGNDL